MFGVHWIGAGVEHSCAIQVVDSRLKCWGKGEFRDVPQQITYSPKLVSTKYFQVCAFKDRFDLI